MINCWISHFSLTHTQNTFKTQSLSFFLFLVILLRFYLLVFLLFFSVTTRTTKRELLITTTIKSNMSNEPWRCTELGWTRSVPRRFWPSTTAPHPCSPPSRSRPCETGGRRGPVLEIRHVYNFRIRTLNTTWLNHVISDAWQLDHFFKNGLVRTPQDKIPTQHIPPPNPLPGTPLPDFVLRGPNPFLKSDETVVRLISHGFVT